jgi:integrase
MPKLSDTAIRAAIRTATAGGKSRKKFDTDGLYLIVPQGWWRQRYLWGGKEQLLSLGSYPDVSLAQARDKGSTIRSLVANGVNPSAERQQQKVIRRKTADNTYKSAATQWWQLTSKGREWTQDHTDRVHRRLEVHFFPYVGRQPIAEITDEDILECLRRIQNSNILDTLHRALAEQHEIFRWAKTHKLVKANPIADLRGRDLFPRPKTKNHAALKDPAQVGALMRAVESYPAGFVVRQALRLQALTFVRPRELREATWSEIDLDGAEWRIPAARMKMGEQHVVPLSRQAVAILRELYSLTGPDGYLFPSVRNPSRPMSNNTINAALRTLGFTAEQQTGHGFRSTASTLLNESGKWNADAIERQLAHGPRDKVRAAYNSAQYLPERKKMMQSWADYLDGLKSGTKVTVIGRGRAA